MKRISQLLIINLFVTLVLGLTSCTPKPQNDCGFVQNIYGQRISWKSNDKIPLFIHSSVPMALRPAIYHAAETWEAQIGRKLFAISEDSSQINGAPARDQKNGIYFLSNWESDNSSEQGRTSVYWAGDAILEADIRVNAFDFSFYGMGSKDLFGGARVKALSGHGNFDGYSFEALILHELGHFLGLKHQDNTKSVMMTHLAAFENRTQVSALDQDKVRCEYN